MTAAIPTPSQQFNSGISVLRFAATSIGSDGYATADSTSVFTITASIQPMMADELQMLPEGKREKGAVRIFTNTELRTVDEANGTKADIVTFNGHEYEIINVDSWQMGALDHYDCVGSLL